MLPPDDEEPPPKPDPIPQSGSNLLWEEYKLIQGKIDKAGEFQYKVKSWSAALLGAILVGGSATSQLFSALFCALVFAATFHLAERRQRYLSQLLGRRASAIERAL